MTGKIRGVVDPVTGSVMTKLVSPTAKEVGVVEVDGGGVEVVGVDVVSVEVGGVVDAVVEVELLVDVVDDVVKGRFAPRARALSTTTVKRTRTAMKRRRRTFTLRRRRCGDI